MKALIVVGSDLSINSSANLCHTAYINGLLNYGCDVTFISGATVDLGGIHTVDYAKFSAAAVEAKYLPEYEMVVSEPIRILEWGEGYVARK